MQILWGKILAEEVKNPNSFSLRTLSILKNISNTDAKIFQKAVALSSKYSFIVFNRTPNELERYGLSF